MDDVFWVIQTSAIEIYQRKTMQNVPPKFKNKHLHYVCIHTLVSYKSCSKNKFRSNFSAIKNVSFFLILIDDFIFIQKSTKEKKVLYCVF